MGHRDDLRNIEDVLDGAPDPTATPAPKLESAEVFVERMMEDDHVASRIRAITARDLEVVRLTLEWSAKHQDPPVDVPRAMQQIPAVSIVCLATITEGATDAR